MFILDMFNYVEGAGQFTRQDLAKFIYRHRDCERMARSASVTARFFASSCSKEFLARCCTMGYLDLKNGVAWCRGVERRPFQFDFNCFRGEWDRYTKEMMTVGEMCDEDLFC